MNKFLTALIIITVTVSPVLADSILNVQSGIKYNQQSLIKQYPKTTSPVGALRDSKPPKGTNVIQQTPVIKPQPAPPPPPMSPIGPMGPAYIPTVCSWGRYNATNKEPQVNINNTYNYYGSTEALKENKQETKETIKEKSQAQKDEEERQLLRKRYHHILSNKTTSNEKMCSKMETYYKNADYYELDRVLNHILRLNCDIEKLRPLE